MHTREQSSDSSFQKILRLTYFVQYEIGHYKMAFCEKCRDIYEIT